MHLCLRCFLSNNHQRRDCIILCEACSDVLVGLGFCMKVSDFWRVFLALFSREYLHEYWNEHHILGGGDLWWPSFTSYHLVSHLGLQPLSEITKMAIITQSQHRDLQQKPNPTKFISIFNHQCQPSWILDDNHYKNDILPQYHQF